MAVNQTQKDLLYKFFVVSFGAAPGVTYFGQIVEAFELFRKGTADDITAVRQIVEVYTTKAEFTNIYPSFMSNQDFAVKLINNVVRDSIGQAAKDVAVQQAVAALTGGMSRGAVITQLFQNLTTGAAAQAGNQFKPVADLLANQVAVAQYATEQLGLNGTNLTTLSAPLSKVTATSNTSSAAAIQGLINSAGAGSVFTLTTGTDGLVGTSSDDTFVATAAAVQLADNINGGSGTDTLAITVQDADYSDIERQDGSKNIEIRTTEVEVVTVTARTGLVQNRTATGVAQDTRIDGTNGGNNLFNTGADAGVTRDSDTVDTIVTLSQFTASSLTINSVDTEVNGSALTFNDIQKINGTRINIQDTSSAHNFLFDIQAQTPGAGTNDDAVVLGLTEARGLTINFGTTPAVGANTLPMETSMANADAPQRIGEVNNDGQFVDNGSIAAVGGDTGLDNDRAAAGFYGFAAANQSKIDTLTIASDVRGPAGAASVFSNEVLDLNVGAALQTLNITGAAQLKIGLEFGTEQTTAATATNVNVTVASVNPDTSVAPSTLPASTAAQTVAPAPYSYGVTPAVVGAVTSTSNILRDLSYTQNTYALDEGIRTVDASAHFAGVDQASASYAGLPVADLTLDFSNASTGETAQLFTYKGSQGDDLINFGARDINKDIRLGTGNDTVLAGRGTDTIRGEDGNDVIVHNKTRNATEDAATAALEGRGFSAGESVTVYGGNGNDQVVVAGHTAANQVNLVDLGTGNDALYVDDSTDGIPETAGGDKGVANLRIAGGIGADNIVITTAGNRLAGDTVLDHVIFGDVAPDVTGEHVDGNFAQPAARNMRTADTNAGTARVVNANFVADAYFATTQSGGAADNDTILVNDVSNNYANLGNGDNNFVHRTFTGAGGQNNVIIADSSDTVESGSGKDSVGIWTVGSKQVNTRGGDDTIELQGTGNVTVLAGDGNDDVIVNSVSTAPATNIPANFISLGAGDDSLIIQSAGTSFGLTEIYGEAGRDVVSILNADITVNTDHTLYVELGAGADVLELRARDLKNDDTISGGSATANNDGSIDQLILQSDGKSQEQVTFSDTQRTVHFEMVDLRGAGVAPAGANATAQLSNLNAGGLYFVVNENMIATMDQTVKVGDVVSYIYAGSQLLSDGAAQSGTNTQDGLFTAGVLGATNNYDTTGVFTISTVEHGANDDTNPAGAAGSDNVVTSNNVLNLTQTIDLTRLGEIANNPLSGLSADRSFVNFLGGTARDVVVADEGTFNSFSNLRFDEYDFSSNAFNFATNKIDEDNSTVDTLVIVATAETSQSTEITFGDYRNVQGLDVIAFENLGSEPANFKLDLSGFLVDQATSSLVAGAQNAAVSSGIAGANTTRGVLVSVEAGDTLVLKGAGNVVTTIIGGANFTGQINNVATEDGTTVDLVFVGNQDGGSQFLIAANTAI